MFFFIPLILICLNFYEHCYCLVWITGGHRPNTKPPDKPQQRHIWPLAMWPQNGSGELKAERESEGRLSAATGAGPARVLTTAQLCAFSSCLLYKLPSRDRPHAARSIFVSFFSFPSLSLHHSSRPPSGCTVQCVDVSSGDDRPARLKL